VVQIEAGEQRRITMKQVKCFDVLEALPTEVAPGDRLLLTANRREEGLRITNGELVTVAQVDPARRILLDDGRSLPANYRHFMHGYAVTAHRSQGKSVDTVIISADGMQKELFYVAASRGRESVTVITSDKERLKETVAKSMARKSASELVRGAGPIFYPGWRPSVALARRLIQAAAEFIESLPKRLARAGAVRPGKDGGLEHGLSR
jgi:ATP-dependent exoDNAse (exonuclease V) alpha subunit